MTTLSGNCSDIASMAEALAEFSGKNGADLEAARLFRAPGRINLMGDHTDYNGGLVLPMAIDYETKVLCIPDSRVRLRSLTVDGTIDSDATGSTYLAPRWGRYIVGILSELDRQGRTPKGLVGIVDSTVPVGRGLSSSAALEVSFAMAACALADFEIDPLALAQICRRAEEKVAGVECGIMDQAVSVFARKGTAFRLDCTTFEHKYVPIPSWMAVIAIDSGVERSLVSSSYNRRRAECAAALSALQAFLPELESLSEVKPDVLDEASSYLDDLHARRLRHVVTENQRVEELVSTLISSGNNPDEKKLREIFVASQTSLIEDYEAGHPDTNKLVEIALEQEGTIGARQTGAGWGGSIAVISHGRLAPNLASTICQRYEEVTGKSARALICKPAPGASEVVIQ